MLDIPNGIAIWTNTDKTGLGTWYLPTVDSDGHLQVDVVSSTASGGVVEQGAKDASAQAWIIDITKYGGTNVGAGNAFYVQPGTSAVFPINDNGGSITVDGTVTANQGTSPWVISGAVTATQSGTWNIGTVTTITNVVHVDDNGGSLTVDQGADWTIASSASVTGLSVAKFDALNSVQSVKSSSGRIYGYHLYNGATVPQFVQFYNIASGSVTVGTSTRFMTLEVPAGGVIDGLFTIPITFTTAISVAATTTIAGAVVLSLGVLANFFYA